MENNATELAEKGAIDEVNCCWPCSLCCKPYAMLQTTLRLCWKPHPDPFHTAAPRQTFPGSATPVLQRSESDFQLWYQEIKLHYTWRCWALPFVCSTTGQNSHLNSNRLGSLLCLSVFKAIVVKIKVCVKTDPHISNFTVITKNLFHLTLHNSAFRLCCVTSD